MAGRQALCVGINKFEHLPSSNWLNGCVNDAQDVAAALQKQFGFANSDITVLTDSQASKAAVVAALTAMVERAERDEIDRLVFTFSSHGTQVPDTSGDEPDQVDEALAAYDITAAGDAWDTDTVIVDDELNTLFGRVPAGVLVEVLLDTCHSGTGLRALDLLPGRRPKFLPPPSPAAAEDMADRPAVGFRDLLVARARGAAATPVLIAACRADQTAADAFFDGRYNGAFTYYLLRALKAATPGNRREVVRAVRTSLKEGRYGQTPQLEASAAAKAAPFGAAGG